MILFFTSTFGRSLHEELKIEQTLSSTYHPQTDGKIKGVNQMLENILRLCVIGVGGSCDSHLSLEKFSYNNRYESSIGMAPFETLYNRLCRSTLCWGDVGDLAFLGPEMIHNTTAHISMIRQISKMTQRMQASYFDSKHRMVEFSVGDLVFINIFPVRDIQMFGWNGTYLHGLWDLLKW